MFKGFVSKNILLLSLFTCFVTSLFSVKTNSERLLLNLGDGGRYSRYKDKYEYLIAQREYRTQLRNDRKKIRREISDLSKLINLLDPTQDVQGLCSWQEELEKDLVRCNEKAQKINDDDSDDVGNDGETNTKQDELRKEIKQIEVYLEASKDLNGEAAEVLRKEKKEELTEKQRELKSYNSELDGKNLGDIILRGVVGKKNWEMVEDFKVGDNVFEGLGKGVMFRTSVSVGNSIGSIIEKYINTFFSVTLGKVEQFFSVIYRFFFHSSCIPFIEKEVEAWQKMVKMDFMALETMIKDAGKFDSHGREDILREYEQDGKEDTETLNLWRDFIEDQAITYDDLAKEISLRTGYYAKRLDGYGITSCAKRLEHKLLKVSNWLLRAPSLKDFANTPEMKSILPAMRKSIDNYFNNLRAQVTPLSGSKSRSSFADKSDWSSPGFGSNNDYPGVMDNTF